MSWTVGYDENWKRDIGYGVPSICDHPGCTARIDRGLSYVCGGEPYGASMGAVFSFVTSTSSPEDHRNAVCALRGRQKLIRRLLTCRNGSNTKPPIRVGPHGVPHNLMPARNVNERLDV